MYQALYRRWRPKSFSDVVGQEPITAALRYQVAEGKLSHAYLFTGTRGTGKTTCAKILAKAVNCEQPIHGDPCNRCPSCLGIESGEILDVTELDAASNNGVDHVRALREEAIYAPVSVKRRVYIIDEVHMLSVPAFNALLKILEEPPPHLLFILATTELQKVPATILSRCQRFAFRRIGVEEIAARLSFIAEAEGISLTADGAALLARMADGALRDALSLLDQCAAVGEALTTEAIWKMLGLAGRLQTAKLMEGILRRDTAQVLMLFAQLYAEGKDVAALLGELSTLSRDLLIAVTVPSEGDALLSGSFDRETLTALRKKADPSRLLMMTAQLQRTIASLSGRVNRRTDVELCLIRLCDESLSGDLDALCARVARLEEQIGHENGGTTMTPSPKSSETQEKHRASQPIPKQSIPAEERPPWVEVTPEEESLRELGSISKEVESTEANDVATVGVTKPLGQVYTEETIWQDLLEEYKNHLRADKRAFLGTASGCIEGDILLISCHSDIQKKMLNQEEVIAVLEKLTSEALQRHIAVRFVSEDTKNLRKDPMQELIRKGDKFHNFTVK